MIGQFPTHKNVTFCTARTPLACEQALGDGDGGGKRAPKSLHCRLLARHDNAMQLLRISSEYIFNASLKSIIGKCVRQNDEIFTLQ